MTLKMAVFAPMPSASASAATAVNPGLFSSWRKANLGSFIDFGFRFAIFDWSVVRRALTPFARLAWDRHGLRPSDHTGVHCLEALISTSVSIFASAPSISTCRSQRLPRCWFQCPVAGVILRLAMVPEAKKLIPTDPPFRSVSSFTTRLGSMATLTKTLTFGFWTTIFA